MDTIGRIRNDLLHSVIGFLIKTLAMLKPGWYYFTYYSFCYVFAYLFIHKIKTLNFFPQVLGKSMCSTDVSFRHNLVTGNVFSGQSYSSLCVSVQYFQHFAGKSDN